MNKSETRILVVDDDRQLLLMLTETLESIGYTADDAKSAKEALGKLAKSKFHLIISDIKMPEMDGFSLLVNIRENYPGLPVIFITGVPSAEIIPSANPEGILSKPFRISSLVEMIEQTLGTKSSANFEPSNTNNI